MLLYLYLYNTNLLYNNFVSNYTVEVYYGNLSERGDLTVEGKTLRLLKTYNFTATGIDGELYWGNTGYTKDKAYIPINDIRALLTDEDYESIAYSGQAEISFKITLNTYKQGQLVGYLLAHIGK